MTYMLDTFITQIQEQANQLGSHSFERSRLFTNAVLHCPCITNLIRDAEPQERALFTVNRREGPQRKEYSISLTWADERKENVKASPLKSREPLDALIYIQALEKLTAIYNIEGVGEKIAAYSRKHDDLKTSLQELETLVEQQRERLEEITLGHSAFEAPLTCVTFSDLETEEREISALEEQIAAQEERISQLDVQLANL